VFNSLVCDEILGGAAFNKKKIKHITSKHLGKEIWLSFFTVFAACPTALASNIISFVIDEVPFIQSQMAVKIKEQAQLESLEREC